MSNYYQITSSSPAKSELFYSVFEKLADGTSRGWTVTEFYQNVTAFRPETDCPTKSETKSAVLCDPKVGPELVLKGLSGFYFDWDESYTHDEQLEIRNTWLNQRGNMLKDARWKVEEEFIKIHAPFQLTLIDTVTNTVVESQVLVNDIANR